MTDQDPSDMRDLVDLNGSIRVFDLEELHLDVLNPRVDLEADAGQLDILRAVLREGAEHILNLAADIIEVGSLNPSELPIVVWEDGQAVVVEGNRRLVALRILNDPTLVEDPAYERRLRRLTEGKQLLGEMTCVTYHAREKADRWLELRHTGANDGVGVRSWSTASQERFRDRSGGRVGIHTAFLHWVEDAYPDDAELIDYIRQIRDRQLTTLKRLLFQAARPLLGITWEKGKLTVSTGNPEAYGDFLRQWFADLSRGKVEVNGAERLWSRFTEVDMLTYLRGRQDQLQVSEPELDGVVWEPASRPLAPPAGDTPAERAPTPDPAVVTTDVPPAAVGPAPTQPRRIAKRGDRLFDRSVRFTPFGPAIARLADQASAISVTHQPRVAGVLLRVLIDVSMRSFLQQHGQKPSANDHLWRNVRSAINILDPKADQRDSPLHEVLRMFDRGHGGLAAEEMNDWVHTLDGDTASHEVLVMADRCAPLLVAAAANLRQT